MIERQDCLGSYKLDRQLLSFIECYSENNASWELDAALRLPQTSGAYNTDLLVSCKNEYDPAASEHSLLVRKNISFFPSG